MIVYIYMVLGAAAGIILPLSLQMISGVCDVWKIILLMIAFFFGLVVLHIVAALVLGLLIRKDKEPETLDTPIRHFAICTLDLFLKIVGARVHVTGEEKLPQESFLMVMNHRSFFDAVISVVLFKKQKLAFVSKKENIKIPSIGRYMIRLGCLFLDREDTRAAVKTINKASEMIKNNVASIAICPEGTRNRTEDILLPFHAGSYKIAQKAKCPVAVATVWGTEHLKKRLVFKRTDVFVDVVDVIDTDTVNELRSAELADKTREIMLCNLERYI